MSTDRSGNTDLRTLYGAMTITLVLGTVHAFSVLLTPIELRFGVGRSQASLVYSFALTALTVGVLLGSRVYSRWTPATFATIVLLLGAAGLGVSAFASSLATVWVGYSVIFGLTNGLGYGFALHIATKAYPDRRGSVIGLVTATYALGAAVSPYPLMIALENWGWSGSLCSLALIVAGVIPLVWWCLRRIPITYKVEKRREHICTISGVQALVWLWVGYGSAVFAGLMIIGHATAIASYASVPAKWVVFAPIVLALANMFGGVIGGRLSDTKIGLQLLVALPLISALTTFSIALAPGVAAIIIGLIITGLTYGALIAVYPAMISRIYGVTKGVRIYGIVFTAWGVTGLVAPWTAGWLYDRTQDYTLGLIIAGCLSLMSAISGQKSKP